MQALPAGGGMAAVLADEERVRRVLAESATGLAVAGCNAPAETVISGPLAALESALATCARDGLTAQRLEVSHAFHSELMRPMLDAFGAALARVTFHPATVPIIVSDLLRERVGHYTCDRRLPVSELRRLGFGGAEIAAEPPHIDFDQSQVLDREAEE